VRKLLDDNEITRERIRLQCLGIKSKGIPKGRKGGAGPTGGRSMIFPNGTIGNVPFRGNFVKYSPYTLKEVDTGVYEIWHDLREEALMKVKFVPRPKFYDKFTTDGIPMWKLSSLHGKDCVATTLDRHCYLWRTGQQCKFCSIEMAIKTHQGISLARKKPRWFREVVCEAYKEGVCNHITLTSGTPGTPDKGCKLTAEVVKEVKSYVDVPIHGQVAPLEKDKFQYYDMLWDAGLDTIGIHIDVIDPEVLKVMCPGKLNFGLEKYVKAWKYVVDLFGEDQVTSFVLAGLGERDEVLIAGMKLMASIGVIPYLNPFRPLPETPLADMRPPDPERMIRLFRELRQIILDAGLDVFKNKGGCMRCGACSSNREVIKYGI